MPEHNKEHKTRSVKNQRRTAVMTNLDAVKEVLRMERTSYYAARALSPETIARKAAGFAAYEAKKAAKKARRRHVAAQRAGDH